MQRKTPKTENLSIELVPHKLLERKFGAVELAWQFCNTLANLHT